MDGVFSHNEACSYPQAQLYSMRGIFWGQCTYYSISEVR